MEQRARETAESDALAASRDYEQRISRLEQQLQQHNFSSSGPDSHPSEPPARAGPGYRWVLVKEGENPPDPPPFHPASLPDVVPPSLVSDQSQGLNHLDDGFSFSSILGSHMGDQPFPLTSPSKPHSPFNNHGSFSRTSISGSAGPLLAADAEALRAALRLKLTEFAVLQDQVRELKLTRDQLAEELVKATQQSNMASEALETMSSLRQEVEASQAKYIAAVEMLGEKDEALEELRADLQDVKNLYRDQIEYLVNAVVAATPPSSPSPKQLNESGVAA